MHRSGRPKSRRLDIRQIHASQPAIDNFIREGHKVVLQRLTELDSKTEKAIQDHVQRQQECLLALQINYQQAVLRQLIYGKVASLQFVSGDATYAFSRTPQSATTSAIHTTSSKEKAHFDPRLESPKKLLVNDDPPVKLELRSRRRSVSRPSSVPSEHSTMERSEGLIDSNAIERPPTPPKPSLSNNPSPFEMSLPPSGGLGIATESSYKPSVTLIPSDTMPAYMRLLSNTGSYASTLFRSVIRTTRRTIFPREMGQINLRLNYSRANARRTPIAHRAHAAPDYQRDASAMVAQLRRRWNVPEHRDTAADRKAQKGEQKED